MRLNFLSLVLLLRQINFFGKLVALLKIRQGHRYPESDSPEAFTHSDWGKEKLYHHHT